MPDSIVPSVDTQLAQTLVQVRACELCKAFLPLGPRPVLAADTRARILIIGQAPGTRVHETGVPWNDPSGDRLRDWMGLRREQFYDVANLAIVPMGFCYPGRGKSGDLPPRPECAPQWHQSIIDALPNLELTLLIGQYAQRYYMEKHPETLTERVRAWREYSPAVMPLVHPSPRNRHWLRNNPWFESELVPELQRRVQQILFAQ
jgi:uracil-DNA glycosylase